MTVDGALVEEVDLAGLVAPYEDSNDPNRRTHIVNPPNNIHIWRPGMEMKELVSIARMTGQKVRALCGYEWVPKHNPEKYDVCEPCMREAQRLMAERGE